MQLSKLGLGQISTVIASVSASVFIIVPSAICGEIYDYNNRFTGSQTAEQNSTGNAGGAAEAKSNGDNATGSTSFGRSWSVQTGGAGMRIFNYKNGGKEQTGFPKMPANSSHQSQGQIVGNESYANSQGKNGSAKSKSGSSLKMNHKQLWNNMK